MRRRLLPFLSALPLLAAPRVQAPDAPWVTFTTAHFRIHCPTAFEAFGRDVASRVEGIRAQYLDRVGYTYPGPIDILIQDPRMEANGMAFPLLRRPFVVLWRTEPEPDSPLNHLRSWPELLLTHELGHMEHLLRPARKPGFWEQWNAVVGPVAEQCPRWVTEGYATLIEGQLTGSGRPHGAFRAAVLRQWAREGKLTPYGALNGTQGFLGGSMAYLDGSAYLEWLSRRSDDPKALQKLWARLASPAKPRFEQAFTATFGFAPKDGYQRFCAEVTHDALEIERQAKAANLVHEGAIFTHVNGWVGHLAVSPDGSKLLAQVLDPKRPGLYVWDLLAPKPQPKAPKDPENLPDHPPQVPSVAATWYLPPLDGSVPRVPVWEDAHHITYQLRLPDAEGVLQPHARRWTLKGGTSAPAAAAPPPLPAPALRWRESQGVWNLQDAEGRPLTRTLSAAWDPAPAPGGKPVFYARLVATGVDICRLDAPTPLAPAPLPADPAPMAPDAVLAPADASSPLPPPATPPVPHPYRVGESLKTFSLAGYSLTPSGLSAQIGAGGNDILGRLNWQVLAGLGDGAGPRGGEAGFSWHGWRWAPSFQVFSSLERPSAQPEGPTPGHDRERRGAELAFTRTDLGRPGLILLPSVAYEHVAPLDGSPTASRSAAALRVLGNEAWEVGRQGIGVGAALTSQSGRTDGRDWTLARGRMSVRWINPWVPVTLHWEQGRVSGDPTAQDQFHLGGVGTSLLPESLDLNRAAQAALPAYSATGDRMRRLRADLGLGPFVAYLEHTAVWESALPRPTATRVAGLELDSRQLNLPMDLVRRVLGNLQFAVGVHRPLDGVMKSKTVVTLSMILRP